MTVGNPKQFTLKDKLVTYIGVFVELYNWRNREQIHELYEIIELEKMCISTVKNFYNLVVHWMIKISLILYNAHLVSRD